MTNTFRLAVATLVCGSSSIAAAEPVVDFARDIEPILTKSCVGCHGPLKSKGSLRLDSRAAAMKAGVLAPGKPAESELLKRIAAKDDARMPPEPQKNLNGAEIAKLKLWIEQGAQWPENTGPKTDPLDWWSLKPLAKPAVPKSDFANPIDAFVRAKLADEGLSPSPAAGKRTLIRRLYFDLIGLPPTPERIAAFEKDAAPDAYSKLVDSLLASKHYGERWARHWLDVVHFGETHGYDKDQPRPNAWPYRDYVIRSFNGDQVYATFVQEQIAGDILFKDSRDGIEALGFIAAGPWDFIGHAEVPESKIDGKIARHLDRDDMVQNTMQTFVSLTVGCAQCHDHKFDPISQEEYFGLQAVFAALDRTDVRYDSDPEVAAVRAMLSMQRVELATARKKIRSELENRAGPALAVLDHRIALAGAPPNRSTAFGYHSALAAKSETAKWIQIDLGKSIGISKVILFPAHDDFNGIGAGFGFPVRYKIEAGDDAAFKTGVRMITDRTGADEKSPGIQPQAFKIDELKARYVRVTATKLMARQNDFNFALAEVEVRDTADNAVSLGAAVTALDSIEAPIRWAKVNLVDGWYPGVKAGDADRAVRLKKERRELLEATETPVSRKQLAEVDAGLTAAERELAALPPQSMAYIGAVHTGTGSFAGTGATGGQPRPIFLLNRGSVTKPGAEVRPGALSAVKALSAKFDLPAGHAEGERRKALALWLTDPKNPLLWRSIVNRVWHYHFGRGLVETANDFGRNGTLPTHPELLDFLAAEFRDGGQSIKKLHRAILLSETYRQASTGDAKTEMIDAGNQYLWRMNRRKLEAEAVRDSVLQLAGKLDLKLYGPSFRDFVVEKPEHSPHYEYHLHDPEDPASHRRSIYRFAVRSQTQPFLTALDCADPSLQVDRRNQSQSPAQALALLNNDFMAVMAKHFAKRLEARPGELSDRVERGFWEAMGRKPTGAEAKALTAHAAKHGLPSLCRLLFNLNEFAFAD